ncbi:MAG: Gfo/Idh/MocA family oxidoreductase [Candidatus Gastranaerophilales bacterium]|nr:Gfo/Idh/MocA family oxidoreductase [Candidatus Gastranaerophilales bacterium]
MQERKIGIIGAGLWGRNIIRNFYNLGYLHTVCDIDNENLKNVISDYNNVNTTNDYKDILNNPEIKGVVVVTPSHTHYKIVKELLEHGKNVYVEKPISTVANEALSLMNLADEKGLVLMVGHLLLYHPVVNRLKMLIEEGVLGEIKYIQSDRLNINYFKNDRSVMWDLAPHDVSMISYIIDKKPKKVVSAVGASSDGNNIMDITHITLEFENGIIGHISDSWIHPQKRVNLLVRGTKATAVFDDTISDNKLQIFDNIKPKTNQVVSLDYIEIEPLKLECQHFVTCIENKTKARSDGENGYEVVKVLEEAEKLMLGETKMKQLDNIDYVSSRTKR